MLPVLRKLTEARVAELDVGRHRVGRLLWLCKKAQDDVEWQVCLTVRGQQRDLCLGQFPQMSVTQARAEAAKWRGLARRGLDPAKEQEAFRDAAARNLHQFYS